MTGNSARRAFLGSFTSAGGLGITAASVDRETGALTLLGSTGAVPDPSFLAVGPREGGTVLYAVGESAPGVAAAFAVDEDVPTLLGPAQAVEGDAPTHLALAANHLVTANYTSGSVTALPVLADGSLGAAASVLRHEGSGPDTGRQEAPHAHQVLADPSGNWLVSVDLGTDSVRVCALDPATGALRLHGETALRPGTGPRHLAFHPSGALAYVLGELEPTLTVCRWDAVTGRLDVLGRTSVLPEHETADAAVRTYPSEVVVAPDGRFLWTANRGHDSISVLTLDESGEKAALAATVGCGGRWPRDLTLDPGGQWLYAANEHSGNVSWFAVDAETGIPRHAGSVEVPAVSCVVLV
ncbi:lactonase family protein [Streptomyces sp. FL06-04B]|uniref:lactonase family protein n=1 Tax=unclassified Streptomyces TaxID=2593676 RepID=UPI0029A51034|nr:MULTISPECIES: lactonase family protein [unclassified Streptomyces]MDX2919606.1 lactonase family protein [Streptomyces sp. NE06-03C]MDX3610193.1 lactonase family protein [Streptomyces sp. FL06-04B]MDX3735831.1 lactonase family protein [Streptomyces sp. ID01-15D]